MRILHLSGTPSEMGEAFGLSCRAEIAELYRLRVATAAAKAKAYGGREVTEDQLLDIAERSIAPSRAFDDAVMAELEGIARGADLSLTRLLALNGLTDFWDAFAWGDGDEAFGGCTSVIVKPERAADGRLVCGQTWDLATDNQPFVLLVERTPAEGPATLAMTCTGCLTIAGLNDRGLAVGTTNVRTPDARAGVGYTLLLHRALSCASAADALDVVAGAERAGAHYYFFAGADDVVAIEASPSRLERVNDGDVLVQGNHCVGPEHCAIEAHSPATTSPARVARMRRLVAEQPTLDATDLMRLLSDTEGGRDAISRDDLNGVSSNGAIVMVPSAGELWACHGPPPLAHWDAQQLPAPDEA
jgi:isopenicillin-N N-acyltransferase-like protein